MNETTDYIFCINTGRSGSDYLRTVFRQVSDCLVFHEPKPRGNGKIMRRYAKGDIEPMRKMTRKKVEKIKDVKSRCRVYVETNHCFIKGFGWFIPDYLPEDRVGVIILKREKSKIAESYLRINHSPLTPEGKKWVTTPDIKNPLVPPPSPLISPMTTYFLADSLNWVLSSVRPFWQKIFQKELPTPRWLRNYELECLEWYVEETTAQGRAFQEKFKKIKYFEVDIENLNSLEEVNKMLDYFGCTAKESLAEVVGKATNLRVPSPQ